MSVSGKKRKHPEVNSCRGQNKTLLEVYPAIASQWHPTKNGTLKPSDVAPKSNIRVWWLCEKKCAGGCLHEWEVSINGRTASHRGCPLCSNQKLCAHTSLWGMVPELITQWHPFRNGTLQPTDVAPGSHQKVWWLCNKTCPDGCKHEWAAAVYSRTGLQKSGCPWCVGLQVCHHISLTGQYPIIAAQWHQTKNGDLKPTNMAPKSHKLVWWECFESCCGCKHEWKAAINNRTADESRCPWCIGKKVCVHTSLVRFFPAIAAQWHPEKNGDLQPTHVSPKSDKKVWWIGECGHEWRAIIGSRTCQMAGCPKCKQSHMEKVMNECLENLATSATEWTVRDIQQQARGIVGRQELDHIFKVTANNSTHTIAIEMDGVQHFQAVDFFGGQNGLVKNQERDARKNQLCQQQKIHLLRICHRVPYDQYQTIVCDFISQVVQSTKVLYCQIGPSYEMRPQTLPVPNIQ
jgi:hypothetical protein